MNCSHVTQCAARTNVWRKVTSSDTGTGAFSRVVRFFKKRNMRPESVVLLYHKDELWRYELFYSRSKAERAFRQAANEGTLETEDGGFHGISPPTSARIVHVGNWLDTQKEPW